MCWSDNHRRRSAPLHIVSCRGGMNSNSSTNGRRDRILPTLNSCLAGDDDDDGNGSIFPLNIKYQRSSDALWWNGKWSSIGVMRVRHYYDYCWSLMQQRRRIFVVVWARAIVWLIYWLKISVISNGGGALLVWWCRWLWFMLPWMWEWIDTFSFTIVLVKN